MYGLSVALLLGFTAGCYLGSWVVRKRLNEQERQHDAKDAQSEMLRDFYERHYLKLLEIGEPFQPGGELDKALTIGDRVTLDGFKFAIDNAIAVKQLLDDRWDPTVPPLVALTGEVARQRQDAKAGIIALPGVYGLVNPKVGDRVKSRWGLTGTIVKVGQTTVTVRVDGGNYTGIWPQDALQHLTGRL